MKRYLSKKLHAIKTLVALTFFGVLFSFLSPFVQAADLDYYKKVFGRDFGFLIYEEDKKISSEKDYLSSKIDKSYLILLSSVIPRDSGLAGYISANKKIILICDTPYSEEGLLNFTCDKSTANSSQMGNIEGFLKPDDTEDMDLYIIPENIIASTEGRSKVEDYLKAFKRSDEAPLVSEDAEKVSELKKRIDEIKALTKTMAFETFGIALSMFLIVTVSLGLARAFLGNKIDVKPQKTPYKSINSIREFFTNHRWVMIYIILILSILYIPVIAVLGIKDGQGTSIGYFINYSIDTIKPSNLVGYIRAEEYFRLVIFFYNFVYLTTVFTLLLPCLIDTSVIAVTKIENAKLKPDVHKYSVPVLIVLSIISSSFFEVSESNKFLILMTIILAYIVFDNFRFKTFDYSYSIREKIIFIFIAVSLLFLGFFMKFTRDSAQVSYKEEELIGVTDKIVTLPYSKQLGEEVIFKDFMVSFPEPVFTNQYMVYSPNNSRVENKNALEFKNTGSFYIQNGSLKDMVSAIYANKDLSEVLISNKPSNFFRVENLGEGFSKDSTQIEITFSCKRQNLGIDKIKANFYYLAEDGELKESSETIMHFPGCSRVGRGETFTVEFNPPYVESGYFFVRLVDVLPSDIESIKIIISDMVIEPTYYFKGQGYMVIASGGLESSRVEKVTNYVFGDVYNLSFDINLNSDGEFNISVPINELVKAEKLKEHFLIWSTKKYIPVRLGL